MKIVVDENMPYVQELFGSLGNVVRINGRAITADKLKDVDALMVRSITPVNQQLLENTAVKFVGTATAGIDHIDQAWLSQHNIQFSSAPGCNAVAVVEYVLSTLLVLAERYNFELKDRSVGIVGVGEVGSRLQKRLNALGIHTLLCDPVKELVAENKTDFYSFNELINNADVISLHTPLIKQGQHPTYHLINQEVLASLAEGTVLINASRGKVVDNRALFDQLTQGKKIIAALDVWENEPDILLPLLSMTDIATPHIAGYSLEGRVKGTTQLYQAFTTWLGNPLNVTIESLLPKATFDSLHIENALDQERLKRLIHFMYDVRTDDLALRRVAHITGAFDKLRKNYQLRREFSSLYVKSPLSDVLTRLQALGFGVHA